MGGLSVQSSNTGHLRILEVVEDLVWHQLEQYRNRHVAVVMAALVGRATVMHPLLVDRIYTAQLLALLLVQKPANQNLRFTIIMQNW